jgi:small-conductance mechanosensitive channel
LSQLDAMQARWDDAETLLAGWDGQLGKRAAELDGYLTELTDLTGLWERTKVQLVDAGVVPTLMERVDATLSGIQHARAAVTERRDAVLTLRNRVARERALAVEVRALIETRRVTLLGNLHVRDQPPLWSLYRVTPEEPMTERLRTLFVSERSDLREFVRSSRAGGPRALVVLGGILVAMGLLTRRGRRWQAEGRDLDGTSLLMERPISAALVLWALLLPWLHVPMVVRQLAYVVMVVPVARLLEPLVGRLIQPAVAFLVPLVVLDRWTELLSPVPELARPLFLALMVVGIAAIQWLRRAWASAAGVPAAGSARWWIDRLSRVGQGALGVAAVADVAGYRELASLLGDSTIASGYAALAIWVLTRVIDGLVAMALRSWPCTALRVVRQNQNRLLATARRCVHGVMVVAWLVVALHRFHLWGLVTDGGRAALDTPLHVGALVFTLGGALVFVLSVWASFVIARALRAVLEQEILSRVQLPRGIPYAISTFSSYAVLVAGVLMAFAAAGVDMSRLAIVFGALGVGVGLGLQEIVKDLVAGAVLLFERPIQLGDVVQMGDLNGDVRRIGLRSSTIHTFDGAEVIVPNSSLTTAQIVNWTLSDRARRVDLPVGVAYGTDPARVIALLEGLARKHPDVLEDPVPRALFTGFGDSALQFELRTWTNRVDQVSAFRSELGVAVNAALGEAGITVPFPQHDVHLRTPA